MEKGGLVPRIVHASSLQYERGFASQTATGRPAGGGRLGLLVRGAGRGCRCEVREFVSRGWGGGGRGVQRVSRDRTGQSGRVTGVRQRQDTFYTKTKLD